MKIGKQIELANSETESSTDANINQWANTDADTGKQQERKRENRRGGDGERATFLGLLRCNVQWALHLDIMLAINWPDRSSSGASVDIYKFTRRWCMLMPCNRCAPIPDESAGASRMGAGQRSALGRGAKAFEVFV